MHFSRVQFALLLHVVFYRTALLTELVYDIETDNKNMNEIVPAHNYMAAYLYTRRLPLPRN